MSIERIVDALLADPAISGLVGGRVALSELDSGTKYPAIVYNATKVPQPYLDNDDEPQPVKARVQINPIATTVSGVCAIHDAISLKLDGLHNVDIEGFHVTYINRELEGPWSKDAATQTWTRPVDFMVTYDE